MPKKRRERPEFVQTIEPRYVHSNDPEQMKFLAQIQGKMRAAGSKFSVSPNLKVENEIRWLKEMRAIEQRQIDILDEMIETMEKSKLYKRLVKAQTNGSETTWQT